MFCSAITSTSPPPMQCKEQPLEAPREIWGVTLVLWTKKQVIYPEWPVLSTFSFATHAVRQSPPFPPEWLHFSCKQAAPEALWAGCDVQRNMQSLKRPKSVSGPAGFGKTTKGASPLHSSWSKVAGCNLLPFTVLLLTWCWQHCPKSSAEQHFPIHLLDAGIKRKHLHRPDAAWQVPAPHSNFQMLYNNSPYCSSSTQQVISRWGITQSFAFLFRTGWSLTGSTFSLAIWFFKRTVLIQNMVIRFRLQKSKQLRMHGNSPYHSFKQVVNDEVRLGDNNEQRHMGPSKLEEKTACSPACLGTLPIRNAGRNQMLLATSQTGNGSCTCAFPACTFTTTNTKSHEEQGTVTRSNLWACSSAQAQRWSSLGRLLLDQMLFSPPLSHTSHSAFWLYKKRRLRGIQAVSLCAEYTGKQN